MTGQINVNKIAARTGTTITIDTGDALDVTLVKAEGTATTNLKQGLAKLWAAYDQRGDVLGGAGTSGDTFNSSSIVDVLEGHLDVSFSNNMANATYSMCATTHYSGTLAYDEYSRYCGGSNMAAGTFRLASQYSNGNEQDCYWNGILVHGDLA